LPLEEKSEPIAEPLVSTNGNTYFNQIKSVIDGYTDQDLKNLIFHYTSTVFLKLIPGEQFEL